MRPDWFVIVEQWIPRKMGFNGVTLPFVIGALGRKNGTPPSNAGAVRAILDEMVSQPVQDFVAEAMWCPDIAAPVFAVKRLDDPKRIKAKAVLCQPGTTRESLVFSFNLASQWGLGTAEELRRRLEMDAEKPVKGGQFSRIRRQGSFEWEYGAFSEREIRYIDETIVRPAAR